MENTLSRVSGEEIPFLYGKNFLSQSILLLPKMMVPCQLFIPHIIADMARKRISSRGY
jgi:hypothetical protein